MSNKSIDYCHGVQVRTDIHVSRRSGVWYAEVVKGELTTTSGNFGTREQAFKWAVGVAE